MRGSTYWPKVSRMRSFSRRPTTMWLNEVASVASSSWVLTRISTCRTARVPPKRRLTGSTSERVTKAAKMRPSAVAIAVMIQLSVVARASSAFAAAAVSAVSLLRMSMVLPISTSTVSFSRSRASRTRDCERGVPSSASIWNRRKVRWNCWRALWMAGNCSPNLASVTRSSAMPFSASASARKRNEESMIWSALMPRMSKLLDSFARYSGSGWAASMPAITRSMCTIC